MFAKLFLRLLGIKADDDERVSEDQLRLLVAGAQKSGGIEAQEGQMINQVLNMQEKGCQRPCARGWMSRHWTNGVRYGSYRNCFNGPSIHGFRSLMARLIELLAW